MPKDKLAKKLAIKERGTGAAEAELAAGAVLAQSDMVAVMTSQAAREFARRAPLAVLQLPFPTPWLTTALLWHRRLRGLVARTARAL